MLNIQSAMVANAFISSEHARTLGPEAVRSLESGTALCAPVFQINYAGKVFLGCLAGGKPDPYIQDRFLFTPLGAVALDIMSSFGHNHRLFLRYLVCTCSKKRMEQKLRELFEQVQTGDHVAFVGDHARTCDGTILPHLNIRGSVTLSVPLIN